MSSRETLKKLTLTGVTREEDELPTLNNLNPFPNLESLAIESAHQIKLPKFFSAIEAPRLHELTIFHSEGKSQDEIQVVTCLFKLVQISPIEVN